MLSHNGSHIFQAKHRQGMGGCGGVGATGVLVLPLSASSLTCHSGIVGSSSAKRV